VDDDPLMFVGSEPICHSFTDAVFRPPPLVDEPSTVIR
jgi:hypothetical protein